MFAGERDRGGVGGVVRRMGEGRCGWVAHPDGELSYPRDIFQGRSNKDDHAS